VSAASDDKEMVLSSVAKNISPTMGGACCLFYVKPGLCSAARNLGVLYRQWLSVKPIMPSLATEVIQYFGQNYLLPSRVFEETTFYHGKAYIKMQHNNSTQFAAARLGRRKQRAAAGARR